VQSSCCYLLLWCSMQGDLSDVLLLSRTESTEDAEPPSVIAWARERTCNLRDVFYCCSARCMVTYPMCTFCLAQRARRTRRSFLLLWCPIHGDLSNVLLLSRTEGTKGTQRARRHSSLPTSCFRLHASDFMLPTSCFRLHLTQCVAMKNQTPAMIRT
jgi:hypothetical protein